MWTRRYCCAAAATAGAIVTDDDAVIARRGRRHPNQPDSRRHPDEVVFPSFPAAVCPAIVASFMSPGSGSLPAIRLYCTRENAAGAISPSGRPPPAGGAQQHAALTRCER